ncbi:hypothetical protein L7F22_036963 [Adiantum nelumboides]|nr:hypothetical protein [Adiantum nelumboides]
MSLKEAQALHNYELLSWSFSHYDGSRQVSSQGLKMALEWAVLAYTVGAEALILLLVTLPGLERLRKGVIGVARSALQPLMAIIPFCLFLLLDIYWKFDNMPKCTGPECTAAEHTKHQKSVMKSQRNAILVIAALLLYWLLYCATHMLVQIDRMSQQLKQLKQRHAD